MKKEIVTENRASAHLLSMAVESGGFIFCSGMVHCDADLKLVGETTEQKVDQIMQNIAKTLKAAGATLDNIVKVVIYVTDMSVMPDLNKVYPTYFTKPYPVREAVCVNALPLGASIELSVIAEKGV